MTSAEAVWFTGKKKAMQNVYHLFCLVGRNYSAAPAGSHRHVRWGILPAALYKRQADRGRDRKVAIRWERYEARPNSARYNCSGPSLKVREARSLQDVLATQGKLKSGQLNDSLRAHVVDPKKKHISWHIFFYTFTAKVFNLEHGRKLWDLETL